MANINELLTGFGIGQQADIVTPTATFVRMNNLNTKPWSQKPVNEDDSKETGKGHEFATALYKSHYDNPIQQLSKYCSSEVLAWVLGFGLGKVVATTGQYIITPLTPATDGTELPYFCYGQQIRPGGSSVLDQLFIGCAIKAWKLSLTNNPGRASAMISADMWHSGLYLEPSAIVLPTAIVLHEMNAGGLTLTINGIDYTTTARSFVSLEMGMDNVIRPGFFPGSGTQDGYQLQGRGEIGDRVPSFVYVARYNHGSPELTNLRALTAGPAVISLTHDAANSMVATWQLVAFETAEVADAAGVVTISVTAIPMFDPTNGLFSATVKTPLVGICQ